MLSCCVPGSCAVLIEFEAVLYLFTLIYRVSQGCGLCCVELRLCCMPTPLSPSVCTPQDIVMMCQSLEKVFDQKILGMPKEVS